MPTTTPDDIVSPDGTYTGGFRAAMAAMATSIQDALLKRGMHTYYWDDVSGRTGQAGMRAGDFGYQADTEVIYRYSGSGWVVWSNPGGTPITTGWRPIEPTAVVASTGVVTESGGHIAVSAVPATLRLEGIFADDYDEYEIRGAAEGSVAFGLNVRLVLASTPDASANYDLEKTVAAAAAATVSNSAAGTAWVMGSGTARVRGTFRLRVVRPKRATFTSFEGFAGFSTATTAQESVTAAGQFRGTTQFDGLELTLSAGTGLTDVTIMGFKSA
jgi:hypothetical protein